MTSNYTEVFAWGNDQSGQLGFGSKNTNQSYSIPRFCSFNILIKQMSCGENHTAFIASNGYVYTMGSNSKGLLGIGDKSMKHSQSPVLVEGLNPTASQISCGWNTTAAVMADGSLYSWGSGKALGLNRDTVAWEPTCIPLKHKALSVSCGTKHMAVIIADPYAKRRMMTCGENESGQLGLGHYEAVSKLKTVKIKEDIKTVSCGVFHTAVVAITGKVYSMGSNNYGQLGIGSNKGSAVPIHIAHLDNYFIKKVACGSYSTALSDHGDVFVWGTGAFGEFLSPQRVISLSTAVKDIAIGKSFSAALDVKGMLWCWGMNKNGELGVGDSESRINPYPVSHLQSKIITSIACGGTFAIALGQDINRSSNLTSPRVSSRKMYDLPLSTGRSESLPAMLSPKSQTQRQFETIQHEIVNLQNGEGELERIYKLLEEVHNRHVNLQKEKEKNDKRLKCVEIELKSDKEQFKRVISEYKKQNENVVRQYEAIIAENQSKENDTSDKDLQIEEQNKHIQQMVLNITELEKRLTHEKENRTRAETMLMNELQIREALETELDQQNSMNLSMNEDREKVESLQNMCNRKSEKITALNNYNETLQTAYDTLKAEHADMTNALEKEFDLIRELEAHLSNQNPEEVEALKKDKSALKKENSSLKEEIDRMQEEIRQMNKKLEESELKYIFLRDEKENLQLNITEQEGQNRREVECMERAMVEKARNYKEKTRIVLDSSPIRTPTQDIFEPLNLSSVNNSNIFRLAGETTPNRPLLASPLNFAPSPNLEQTPPAQSARFSNLFEEGYEQGYESGRPSISRHGLLPEHALRISKSASKLLENLGIDSDADEDLGTGQFAFIRSPEATITNPDPQVQITPPTFRGFENAPQNLLKDSLSDMRSKLASLHNNKSTLAAKMEEFEKKLKETEAEDFEDDEISI